MRQFIEKNGLYIISLPIEWYHKNKLFDANDNDPDTFELLRNSVGSFQISISSPDRGILPQMIDKYKIKSQPFGVKNLDFVEEVFHMNRYDMHMWFAVIGNYFFMAKYIYDSHRKDSDKIKSEITKSKLTLTTLIFVEEELREKVFARFQFDKFMFSLGSSMELKRKAYHSNNPFELIIIIANQIDAALRLCLIMKHQIETQSEEIDIKLIYQKESDKIIMEKTIYNMALEKGIITESLHKELYELYNQRNKVVHRYIISDLTTKEVMKIAVMYSILEEKIDLIVKQFEQQQFKSKVGMYGKDTDPSQPLSEEQKKSVQLAINEKHSHYAFIQ